MDTECEPDNRIIKSYVWHDGNCFFVSTIDRDSSSMYGGRFAETIAWEYDWDKAERGEQIGMDGGAQGSITRHILMCQRLHDTGKVEVEDMKRTIEQWKGCNPYLMATVQIEEARTFAYKDAQDDILELYGKAGVLCDLLKEAEGPLLIAKMDAQCAGKDDDVQDLRELLKRMGDARAEFQTPNA